MEALSSADIFLFEGFRFDRRGLFRQDKNGALGPVDIGSRSLAVLRTLLERPGDVLTRDEIMAAVWPGRVVEDNNLTVQIAALRGVLDQDRAQGGCIQTMAGRGYRFVAPVTRVEAASRSRPRLSIVVLPFTNLSDDREQQYFADGITEDLTTDLSRIVGMFVISRNTAFTYRNQQVDTKQIGRQLGIRYVLEGAVRRLGNQVRVTVQLIDAETDAHLWAERFDGDTGDLFALQDAITRRIAVALNLELIPAEAARPAEHPDAIDFILRGRAQLSKPPSRDTFAEMISQYQRALALDPRSVEAMNYLSGALAARVLHGMSDSVAADVQRADELVSQVLAASPRNPIAHVNKAMVLRAQNRVEEAISEYETAIASNRNLLFALAALGWCQFATGSPEDAIPLLEQAIQLSPRDPQLSVWYFRIGLVHLLQSRTDEAIAWFERARSANPTLPILRASLASAYALKGETSRAHAELTEARRLSGEDLFLSIARLKAFPGPWRGVPKVRALYEATYFAGLRKAGMQEE